MRRHALSASLPRAQASSCSWGCSRTSGPTPSESVSVRLVKRAKYYDPPSPAVLSGLRGEGQEVEMFVLAPMEVAA
jgi:hypothetical protein